MANSSISVAQVQQIKSGISLILWALAIGIFFCLFDDDTWLLIIPLALAMIGFVKINNVLGEADGESVTVEQPRSQPVQAVPSEPEQSAASGVDELRELYDSSLNKRQQAVRKTVQKPTATRPVQAPKQEINWEEWVGQKLLQKLGIVVVLIGMAVFLKYSFDNGWIGELGRIGLSVLTAAVLLATGEWFVGKYAKWAHAFTGGGLALLYFTVWAAHIFYAEALMAKHAMEISGSLATGLYGLITLLGVLASIRYKAQAIAWFALIGGYVTPNEFFTHSAQPSAMMFVVYLVILAAGMMALAWHQRWRYLNLAAFACTQLYLCGIIYQAPTAVFSDTQQLVVSIGFFLLFGLLPILYHLKLKQPCELDDVVLTVANGLLVYLAVLDALGGLESQYVALVSLALAGVYIGYAALALLHAENNHRLVNMMLSMSIVLVALALLAELRFDWVLVAWAPYSALLAWVGLSLKRRAPWVLAHMLMVLSLILLVIQMPILADQRELLWQPFTSSWALKSYVIFAALASWIALVRYMQNPFWNESDSGAHRSLMHGVVAALVLAIVTFEATALDFTFDLIWTAAMVLYAYLALRLFLFFREPLWLVAAGIGQVLALSFAFVFGESSGLVHPYISGVDHFPLLHSWTIVSVAALGISLSAIYSSLQSRNQNTLLPHCKVPLIFLAAAQVWVHVSIEISHWSEYSDWTFAFTSRMLSVWWALFALGIGVVAIRRKHVGLVSATVVLLAIPFFKDIILLMTHTDWMLETIAWSVGLLGAVIASTSFRQDLWWKSAAAMLCIVAAADMLTHLGSGGGLLRSTWWAMVAMATMAIGFGVREALLRRISIGLFGALLIKLLVFDFSALDTGVRIMASIATGLLMIGASYMYQRFDSALHESR